MGIGRAAAVPRVYFCRGDRFVVSGVGAATAPDCDRGDRYDPLPTHCTSDRDHRLQDSRVHALADSVAGAVGGADDRGLFRGGNLDVLLARICLPPGDQPGEAYATSPHEAGIEGLVRNRLWDQHHDRCSASARCTARRICKSTRTVSSARGGGAGGSAGMPRSIADSGTAEALRPLRSLRPDDPRRGAEGRADCRLQIDLRSGAGHWHHAGGVHSATSISTTKMRSSRT